MPHFHFQSRKCGFESVKVRFESGKVDFESVELRRSVRVIYFDLGVKTPYFAIGHQTVWFLYLPTVIRKQRVVYRR